MSQSVGSEVADIGGSAFAEKSECRWVEAAYSQPCPEHSLDGKGLEVSVPQDAGSPSRLKADKLQGHSLQRRR